MKGDDATEDLPGIDFSTIVLSLATSAMVHLGAVPESEGGTGEKNLPLAQQTIDTLELLQSVLYELRMSFVKARGKPA